MSIRPVFIPLKKEHFHAFARGDKREEYRVYGLRWNERVCQTGRPVTLSCGYGKHNRLSAVIESCEPVMSWHLPHETQRSLSKLYGTKNQLMAVIKLKEIAIIL